MIWELWSNPALLAAVSALLASVRVAINHPARSLSAKLCDIAVAVVLGAALAEYATPAEAPRLSLLVGLVAGGVCDSVLDAVRALSPKAAGILVDGWLAKFGYSRKPNEPPDSSAPG
ncbi:hypothetical protein [Neisseria shayeganii]|uniref:Uncharacterized protein n=1 Tax=Neisseria shayeganii TaxID=607712 RepID=A0A7D7SIB2_9NEIS|nr:hypothetical protein [Neisseria shayeganii]QMT41229.1 hypothetical protein H3L94_04165 [Neisseria shayeganii]